MNPIRALLVDDEEPARDRLRHLLAVHPDIEIVAEAGDGDEAIRKIEETRPDLLFLDIQMPGQNGLQLAASLPAPRPRIVFCTAFDQYAIDAFEQNAVDYLLKPLNRDRLGRTLERVRQSRREQDDLRREIATASRTQARLFPRELPPMQHLEFCGACRPAREVGGDYYDFLAVGERHLGIALGDVSGKGLFAGLLMAGLQARIQSLAPRHPDRLDTLAGELNRAMHATTGTNRFATLFLATFDDRTRRLSWVNAGHPSPLLFRPEEAERSVLPRVVRLAAQGAPIGMLPDTAYRVESIPLRRGDLLVAFSDGLTEARDRNENEFGETRLGQTIDPGRDLPVAELRERIFATIDRFRGNRPPEDDMTLVVARVR